LAKNKKISTARKSLESNLTRNIGPFTIEDVRPGDISSQGYKILAFNNRRVYLSRVSKESGVDLYASPSDFSSLARSFNYKVSQSNCFDDASFSISSDRMGGRASDRYRLSKCKRSLRKLAGDNYDIFRLMSELSSKESLYREPVVLFSRDYDVQFLIGLLPGSIRSFEGMLGLDNMLNFEFRYYYTDRVVAALSSKSIGSIVLGHLNH